MKNELRSILVVGNQQPAFSVALCLQLAGHPVTMWTRDIEKAGQVIKDYPHDQENDQESDQVLPIRFIRQLGSEIVCEMAIVVCPDSMVGKRLLISMLEHTLPKLRWIAVNSESIPLSLLQHHTLVPNRIIGLNWTEPAHLTRFLELISNEQTDPGLSEELCQLARRNWKKDPYLLRAELGIRAKMMAAMFREAAWLVQNGYASVEDIDRACRNDAGYYLPFAGNFRYMDLMGPYAYGMVMKELNPELSNDSELPVFFEKIIKNGGKGMENNHGFYEYEEEEKVLWLHRFSKFSVEIGKLIDRYPFNYHTKS